MQGGNGGPPNGGHGGVCSRRGLFPRGCAPHSLFGCAKKRMRRARWKRKSACARSGTFVPPRSYGGRRIGACSDFAWPSGTLGSSASLQLPSRGGWCGGRRGARTHLTSFSFRAFRFTRKGYAASVSGKAANGCAAATRCPGGRRGRCPHRPVAEATSTTGQRQRKETQDVSQTSPGQRSPQGQRVSVPDRRAGQPAIPRRRQEVSACADRPAEAFFLFGPCTARFSFGKTKDGAPAAPRAVGRGGARERAQFSPQAETELSGLCDDDNGGCIAQLSS